MNLLVRKPDQGGVKLWLTKGYDPSDGSNQGRFLVVLRTSVPSVDLKYKQNASYLGYHYDPDKIFVLHGKDFIVKFPRNTTGSDESNNCVTSGIKSVTFGLETHGSAISSLSAIDASSEFSIESAPDNPLDIPFGFLHKINTFSGLL